VPPRPRVEPPATRSYRGLITLRRDTGLVGPTKIHDDYRLAAPAPSSNFDGSTFVLSCGGNLGALQVGAIRSLIERGIRPGLIVGTSIGEVNGTFLAGSPNLEGIARIVASWSALRRKDVLVLRMSTLLGGLVVRRGPLFDPGPMRNVVNSHLPFDRIEDATVPLAIVATEVETGQPVVLRSGDLVAALMASCAIPRVLRPVEVDGTLLSDGGAAAKVPLREAVALGGRELYVIPKAPLQVERLRRQVAERPLTGAEDLAVHLVEPPNAHLRSVICAVHPR
jgi:predicted acylesterase/phospholipase RssA